MKRIVVFLLVIALAIPTLFSCGMPDEDSNLQAGLPSVNVENLTPVQSVAKMYSVSQPTKVVATTRFVLVEGGILELKGNYEIVTGYVDDASASIFKSTVEEIRSVEEGGQNDEVKPLKKTTTSVIEAIEGVGSRLNGGEWDAEGTVWTVGRGRMAINLKEELLKNVTYENHTLTFDVAVENAAAVLGEEYAKYIGGDVHIVIVDDGASVLSIEISYNTAVIKDLPEVAEGEEPLTQEEIDNAPVALDSKAMYIKVDYTYDFERITIE